MKPLRLVMVTRRFWPSVGGMEKTLARLAVGLADRGCRTTVLTARWHPRWPGEIRYHDLRVIRLSPPPEGRWSTWRYARSIARWLRGHCGDLDLVYVSGLRHEAEAAIRAVGGRCPVVLRPELTGRSGDCFWQLDAGGGRRIKARCMRADAFVASTPAIRLELEAAGYPRPRIHEVPLGIAVLPPRTPASRASARAVLAEANASLQLADWAPLAVSMGRWEPGGGWELLVAAWRTLAHDWPSARLWLAGQTPDRDAAQRHIASLGLTGRVVPVGVFNDTDALLSAADLFIAPSDSATPVALLEAMGAGLPIVATDLPIHRWLVADECEGLLAPPGDAEALASAIARLLADPPWAARLGAAAQQRAADKFPLANMVQGHLTLLERSAHH